MIDVDTAAALGRATGLRNVISQVDIELLFIAVTDGLEDLERFASQVAVWTRERGEG